MYEPVHSRGCFYRHLIKRFDTNAVSASSLFRAAFPFATEEEEKLEMRWIAVGSRGQYGDTVKAGMEHDESKKLSGTWYARVSPLSVPRQGLGTDDDALTGSLLHTHMPLRPSTASHAMQST